MFLPVTTWLSSAHTFPLSCTASAKISVRDVRDVSSPCPDTVTVPCFTSYPEIFPSVIIGLPVVNVAALVLINVPLLTAIPLGLAMITCALRPATSKAPFIAVAPVPVTSFKIVLAAAPLKLGLPIT